MKLLVPLAAVASLAVAPAALATAPGSNGRIAFSAVPKHHRMTSAAIYTARSSGRDAKQLTGRKATSPTSAERPVFSPNGTQIAFLGDGFLRIMRADGSHARDVISLTPTPTLLLGGAPTWSRDGRKLALTGYASEEPDSTITDTAVYTVHVDGTHLRRLRAGQDPVWSPDGRLIAYAAASGCGGIRLMKPTGADPRTIVRGRCGTGGGRLGDFSPDGRMLLFSRIDAFAKSTAPASDLFTVSVARGKVRQLTHTPRYVEEDARWSPDGRRLAFARRARTSNRRKVFGTFIATTSGKVISRFHRYALTVSWQPRRR